MGQKRYLTVKPAFITLKILNMKKVCSLLAAIVIVITLPAQVQPIIRTPKPTIANTPNVQVNPDMNYTLPTLQDTVKMLMQKVMQLEQQQMAGGAKSLRVITPNTGNMCFPFKDSRFPSQSFFQGVVVDDAVCNNNPNAVLFVTAQTKTPTQPIPVSVSYDAADGRWKISLQGYRFSGIAKNVQCYNLNGKDQTVCPPSGLYQDVALVDPVTLSPDYDNNIQFNVIISERNGNPFPKIKLKQ
jgi:hypothetical protein